MTKKMMTPQTAGLRLKALMQEAFEQAKLNNGSPKHYISEDFVDGVIKAIAAAKSQTLEGQNEFLKANPNLDVNKMMAKVCSEIAEERKNDPALDEEMTKIEKGIGL
jgi:hypothetical protein